MQSKAGTKKTAELSEQDLSYQHLHPAHLQIPCLYNNLATGGVKSHRNQDKEAPPYAFPMHEWFHPESGTLRVYTQQKE